MDDKDEINRLYELEYGEKWEFVVRVSGVLGGCVLLYFYTTWASALLWGLGFSGAHLAYFLFLRTCFLSEHGTIKKRDTLIAGGLFLLVLISYLWMPSYLVTQDDKALTIVGAALIGCILVFLVRRSDTTPLMVVGEVAVVSFFLLALLARVVPQLDNAIAQAGVVISGLALMGYFAEALRVARQNRLAAQESARRSSQAQKMAAVGQLAGGVAHDFNNKLTAILGSLELLREVDDLAEREANIDTAQTAATEAARTVRQLMIYARKEPMRLALQECAELLDDVLRRAGGVITGMIQVELRHTEESLYVMADRTQLSMAITNLVVNAVDAMPDGGKLVIGASAVSLSSPILLADGTFLPAGPHVAISVKDTGEGIPAKLLPHVVEPFFTTKPVGKGSGLGLAMVLGIARELDGGFGISSGTSGTRAVIYLPRKIPLLGHSVKGSES
ncbi:sensor histidine kinase [Puniceibacterium sediminis]|uniref:histidine kinase n=1 Tax=Puniceibacterium sediminis TaxID=1608407 RepID=A0A238XWW2_9RHOB|nr:ATP-binding protein [Puniceibacterium sediminis]SNR63011.1 His Kinase A (phospho-acceptor) domain-containing protein [Puniceibacterium sediminis]